MHENCCQITCWNRVLIGQIFTYTEVFSGGVFVLNYKSYQWGNIFYSLRSQINLYVPMQARNIFERQRDFLIQQISLQGQEMYKLPEMFVAMLKQCQQNSLFCFTIWTCMFIDVCNGCTFIRFICLFGVFRPTREFFTHLETSPLPVKGCKFWPMVGTYDHWAVRGI